MQAWKGHVEKCLFGKVSRHGHLVCASSASSGLRGVSESLTLTDRRCFRFFYFFWRYRVSISRDIETVYLERAVLKSRRILVPFMFNNARDLKYWDSVGQNGLVTNVGLGARFLSPIYSLPRLLVPSPSILALSTLIKYPTAFPSPLPPTVPPPPPPPPPPPTLHNAL